MKIWTCFLPGLRGGQVSRLYVVRTPLLTRAGPVSLVVTTGLKPGSMGYRALLSKLSEAQRKRTAPLPGPLFAHVLHLDPSTEPQPNAFLNLARLFAPTPHVVLFPGNLTAAPPRGLYRTLLEHYTPPAAASPAAPFPPPSAPRRRSAAVLTQRGQTAFPFAPGASLVLARDDPTWCAERAFGGARRESDWAQCLWQVWLARFGDLEVRQSQGWATLPRPHRGAGADVEGDAVGAEGPITVSFWSLVLGDGGRC